MYYVYINVIKKIFFFLFHGVTLFCLFFQKKKFCIFVKDGYLNKKKQNFK